MRSDFALEPTTFRDQSRRHWMDVAFSLHIYCCLCHDASPSVRLSVTEVHWRIIANLGFKFRPHFTAHWPPCCCGRRVAGGRRAARRKLLAGESSRAMLASARVSCCCFPWLMTRKKTNNAKKNH